MLTLLEPTVSVATPLDAEVRVKFLVVHPLVLLPVIPVALRLLGLDQKSIDQVVPNAEDSVADTF